MKESWRSIDAWMKAQEEINRQIVAAFAQLEEQDEALREGRQ